MCMFCWFYYKIMKMLRFLLRGATHSAVRAVVPCLSVRLSVCLSCVVSKRVNIFGKCFDARRLSTAYSVAGTLCFHLVRSSRCPSCCQFHANISSPAGVPYASSCPFPSRRPATVAGLA